MNAKIELQLTSEWDEVLRVNESVSRFLSDQGAPAAERDTLTMVACELVENAIKYGVARPAPQTSIELRLSLARTAATVQVLNFTDETSQVHLRRLDRALQWVRGFQDPFQAYVERVKDVSREPAQAGQSGLGIVRIAYEAHAAIDFVVAENDTLTVSAVARTGRFSGGSHG